MGPFDKKLYLFVAEFGADATISVLIMEMSTLWVWKPDDKITHSFLPH
jgi:hypothetical protein